MDLVDTKSFQDELERYLSDRYGRGVKVAVLEPLGGEAGEKGFGYGRPVRATLKGAPIDQVVVHTVSTDRFGHDSLADRAATAVLAFETFNNLPGHVGAVDVGAFTTGGRWVSLRAARDFFLITEYGEGEPYFRDLERICRSGHFAEFDCDRAEALASYLAAIHASRKEAPALYLRRNRDLFGHHECILGLLDSYDAYPLAEFTSAEELRGIERRCVDWRHRLKGHAHRLCRVHGDFHPWNVLWGPENRLALLDRSRGEWGEAADDVSCMAINYLFFSLEARGDGKALLRELWQRFFDRYLAASGDQEIARVIPPYFVWRALVIASPLWYPSLAIEVRRTLFRFIDRVLDLEAFAPRDIDALLE